MISMDIAQKLRSEGFKVTPQRLVIYDALHKFENHPNAEMIYQSLKATHPSMSLATIYKTMEIFEKIRVVRVLDVGEDSHRYDYDVDNHAHIRCSCCNRIMDLHGVDIDELYQKAGDLSKFAVTGLSLSFEGLCPECLKEKQSKN